MTLGEGIFLSTLVLSLTALFIATKDRWNWKKILKNILLWPTVILLGIAALAGGGTYVISLIPTKPKVEENFWGITLNTSKADLKFMKGEPTTKTKDGGWTYTKKKYENDWSAYRISFRDDKIRYILFAGSSWLDSPDLQEIQLNDSSQEVQSKFGEPTHTVISEDQLRRIYCYENYHVFFILEHDQVQAYGIFNPAFGPLQFSKKTNAGK